METPIIEPKLNLLLTPQQATLLLMAISSGMINMEAFQKTMSIVLGDTKGEASTTSMIQKLSAVGIVIQKELEEFHSKQTPPLQKV